jgi:thiol-disulfide isomerase/thioredoxin
MSRSASVPLAVAGVLLVSGVGGFLFHRFLGSDALGVRPVERSVAPPPPAAASARPLAIPEALPEFSLPDLKGVPHHLADWRGQPLMINFWATWCEPCRREIPLLEALRRENAGNHLEVVGIAIDQPDSVRKFAKDLGIEYPVLVGEQGGLEAVTAFGVDTVLPFTVFADARGRIVKLKIGELHRDEATFILARLPEVGTGRLSVQAAREQIGEGLRHLAVSRAAASGD